MEKLLYYDYLIKNDYTFLLVSSDKGLCYIGLFNTDKIFWNKWKNRYYPTYILKHDLTRVAAYKHELNAYLNGETTSLAIPLDLLGTNFQREVWHALQSIPYGETTSYSAVAEQINRPKAVRAVANAIAKNPLLIVVPCHRIISKTGNLTGFRSGLALKKWLLELESKKYTKSNEI
ncbi:Methylated-DNA--protein-cysteine methyltransferase, inducible [Paraliobacillus sp. PM-2]|uniref:methylated-DNA--[protein]-cysteine S-methyltransferase n=1 Tax=Paraliobacillus sp. PM-2 TaxID=1462524 RepID=UPI00061BCE3C|nr:methylated-DNA--[protein]-cysteine S-methyltransferase [Paraliobacillus sp. PM-2]CQR47914.1 Methylated-DNA--protein-cysteine methyltransferase, inducible [Paraliobacillus sp. PM-2]